MESPQPHVSSQNVQLVSVGSSSGVVASHTNTKKDIYKSGQDIFKMENEKLVENNVNSNEDPIEESSYEIIMKCEPGIPTIENIENENQTRKRVWQSCSSMDRISKRPTSANPRGSEEEVPNRDVENLTALREELLRQQIYNTKMERHYAQQRNEREREKHEKEMELLDIQICNEKKKL